MEKKLSMWRLAGGVLVFFLTLIGVPTAIKSWSDMFSPEQVAETVRRTEAATRLVSVVEQLEDAVPMLESTLIDFQKEINAQTLIVNNLSSEMTYMRDDVDRRFGSVSREIQSLWDKPVFNNTGRVDSNLNSITAIKAEQAKHAANINQAFSINQQQETKIRENKEEIDKLKDAYGF